MANGIISRQHDIDGADAVFDDLLSAINWAKNLCSEHVFIAGGAQIYKWALNSDLVDELWLSTLPFTCEGDAHFPQFDASKWNVEREEREAYVFEMWKKLK
jgi:dihydrofolate reductase